MGRPTKDPKTTKKDIHISLDPFLYKRLIEFLSINKGIGKSELISRLIEEFLKSKDF